MSYLRYGVHAETRCLLCMRSQDAGSTRIRGTNCKRQGHQSRLGGMGLPIAKQVLQHAARPFKVVMLSAAKHSPCGPTTTFQFLNSIACLRNAPRDVALLVRQRLYEAVVMMSSSLQLCLRLSGCIGLERVNQVSACADDPEIEPDVQPWTVLNFCFPVHVQSSTSMGGSGNRHPPRATRCSRGQLHPTYSCVECSTVVYAVT